MRESLYSTPRAAEYLGISSVTLHRAVKRGIIKPDMVTPGGNLRFSKEELDRYMRESVANLVQRNGNNHPDAEDLAPLHQWWHNLCLIRIQPTLLCRSRASRSAYLYFSLVIRPKE